MARPLAPLNELTAHAALDYVERALERRADVFSVPLEDASGPFFELQAARARTQEWLDAANVWFDTYLSAAGRARMLGALRRRRAGASQTSTTMRLPRSTLADLVSLASKLDLSPNAALAGLLRLVHHDKHLQAEVKRLAH